MEFQGKVDLVLREGIYLDVVSRKFYRGDIAINNGKIVGIGSEFEGKEERNIRNKYVVPGFIDGHIHLESSVISPEDFAKIACIHGTTAVVTDPHEIANVCGKDGIEYMLQKTKNLPISVYFTISSCVPATPFDESAYTLDSKETAECFNLAGDRAVGLAEMMNYPGVLFGDKEVLGKIEEAKKRFKRVDGHAPGLTGKDLEKYIKAGIESDHECTTIEEAKEKIDVARKLNQDFYVMIREGTAAKNLDALAELMNNSKYKEYVTFSTDDKHPEELRKNGHIDYIIRKAISLGVKPEDAYATATYNAAKYFGLDNMGKIQIGTIANLVVLDNPYRVTIDSVYKSGKQMTADKIRFWPKNVIDSRIENKVKNSIHMREIKIEDIKSDGNSKQVIGLVPGEIITTDEGATKDYDLENDIIKAVVIESHKGTMHTGIAYLKGMGLKKGAVGTTVAHDSHYMILAGTNDEDIVTAANKIIEMQGGKVYVEDGEVKAKLALPIAGLMTEENPKEVINKMRELKEYAKTSEGIDPYMNLSFVSLAVIGKERLLPGGAFDVEKFGFLTQEELDKKYLRTHGMTQNDDNRER